MEFFYVSDADRSFRLFGSSPCRMTMILPSPEFYCDREILRRPPHLRKRTFEACLHVVYCRSSGAAGDATAAVTSIALEHPLAGIRLAPLVAAALEIIGVAVMGKFESSTTA